MRIPCLVAGILLVVPPALTAADLPPPPPPPPETASAPETSVPPSVGVDEELQPEVRIIKRNDAEIHEYRMNGALYMVKVIPVAGPPYYLIDTTGDGNLNQRRSELDPAFVVPSWMIFRW